VSRQRALVVYAQEIPLRRVLKADFESGCGLMAELGSGHSQSLDAALTRLAAAISHLETSVGRRLDGDHSLNALHDDIQRLGEDRSQLAMNLDKAEARAQSLEDANREVSRRLVSAMETIRSVLEAHGG
jgi:chromosome segregation ATPase